MRGPDRPNQYDDLRHLMEGLEPEAAPRHQEPPSGPDPVENLRSDNARMAADNAAAQHASDRSSKAERDDAEALENARRLSEKADELRTVSSRFQALGQNPADLIEEKEEQRTGKPVSPHDPYIRALREGAERDPYEAMRSAAMEDYAAFQHEQKRFDERIEEASTLDARSSLEQRKDIHAAEHLAATHHRIADQDEILQGSRETDLALAEREQAAKHEEESQGLQERYRQRTGRDAETDGRSDEGSVRGSPSPTPKTDDLSAEWTSVGEITDAKRERLAALGERWEAASQEVTAHNDGPSRPQTAGRTL